ncbi:hypothetical protein D3C75_768440 [compost metagenome]
MRRHPSRDPFPPQRSKPVEYVLDTGEPFRAAVQRLAQTHTEHAAALDLGYSNQHHLRADLVKYGVAVTFQRPGAYTLAGVSATLREHAAAHGVSDSLMYWRVRRWGLCDRVFTTPVQRRDHRHAQVEQHTGEPFWGAVQRLARQGHSRRHVARELGYVRTSEYATFSETLRRHPDKNPWRTA